METLQAILTIGFLVGVCVFIIPLFIEMFIEAIMLLVEWIDYDT